MSKAWLGQTLTTDVTGQKGTIAATQVHEWVRQDVLADDARKEARTIRRDLLAPMTRLRFGAEAPVPHLRRKLNRLTSAEHLSKVLNSAVNQLGLSVPAAWAHDALGLPRTGQNEAAVPGRAD